jgi:hypothetical protein
MNAKGTIPPIAALMPFPEIPLEKSCAVSLKSKNNKRWDYRILPIDHFRPVVGQF